MKSRQSARRASRITFFAVLASAGIALALLWPSSAGAAAVCDPTTFKNADGSFDTAGYLQCSAPTVSDTSVAPGGSITFKGGGFAPNSVVTITLHSTPVELGTTNADAQGNFSVQVVIPSDTEPGAHTLEAAGVDPNGNPLTVSQAITVASNAEVAGQTQTSGALPFTGSDVGRYVGLGLGLVAIGGAAVWGTRRAAASRS